MGEEQHKFFSRTFYILAAYFGHYALKFGYSVTRHERTLDFDLFGELSHAECIIIGLPFLWAGFMAMSAIAWSLLLTSTKPEYMVPFPLVPGQNVPRTFWLKGVPRLILLFLFYLWVALPVIAMAMQVGRLNSRVQFINLDSEIASTNEIKTYTQVLMGRNLAGTNNIYLTKNYWDRWRVRGQDQNPRDRPQLSVKPFLVPILWDLMFVTSFFSLFSYGVVFCRKHSKRIQCFLLCLFAFAITFIVRFPFLKTERFSFLSLITFMWLVIVVAYWRRKPKKVQPANNPG